MPIFRFNCAVCGEDFELLLKTFDTPAQCFSCGSTNVKKLLNQVNSITPNCKNQNSCASAHSCSGNCGCHH